MTTNFSANATVFERYAIAEMCGIMNQSFHFCQL